MTTTLRLELFFGVPLAKATAGESGLSNHTFGRFEEEDAFHDRLLSLDGPKLSKAGFYQTLEGEVEGAVFFGIPVKRVDLHRSTHHVEIGQEIGKLSLVSLAFQYKVAAEKSRYAHVLKALGQGEPRVLAILTSSH